MIVDISTSAAKKFFVYYARRPTRLHQVVLGPEVALAASGSDYYTISLVKYKNGVETGIPLDDRALSYSTDVHALAVGIPVLLPSVGRMRVWLSEEESLYLKVAVTGSPGALGAKAQVELRSR